MERGVVGEGLQPAQHDEYADGYSHSEGHEHHLGILHHEHAQYLAYLRSVYTAQGNLTTAILGLEVDEAKHTEQ